MQIEVRTLRAEDLPRIAATRGGDAWKADNERWSRYVAEQNQGLREVLLADTTDAIVAYASLARISQNLALRKAGIPEIQDLVVAEAYRNAGLGTRMIHALEECAWAAGHSRVGIGVGLYRDYGAAQRLYSKLGYVLDGGGVSYKNAGVEPGSLVRVDDDLVIWMVKLLQGGSGCCNRAS
jgi:GNAT superfamily N-acetyltransferase